MISFGRLVFLLIGVFGIFGLVIFRLGQLQLVWHKELRTTTMREVTQKEKTRPLRGRLFDRQGRLLALSLERPSIYMSPRELTITKAQAFRKLETAIADVAPSAWQQKRQSSSSFIWIKRLALPQEGQAVAKLKIPGIGVTNEMQRFYPQESVAQELIGHVGVDSKGLGGLERGLDPLLNVEEEVRIVLRDALGKVFSERPAPHLNSKNKNSIGPFDVFLTIDAQLQALTERHLWDAMRRHEAKGGMAIVQEVATGNIVVFASKSVAGKSKESQVDPNLAASLTFEPGSVLKPFVMALALEQRIVSESDRIDCEGGKFPITQDVIIRDHEPRGVLTINEVITYSSNIGMAKIGMRLGAQTLFYGLRSFGFGVKTAVPATGEATGLLRSPETWSQTTLPTISFGQEIGVTAIQLTNAFAALANRGQLLQPRVIAKIAKAGDDLLVKEILYEGKLEIIREAIDSKIADRILNMLELVVTSGTGVKAKIDGCRIAGKTGTAQKIDPATGKYSNRNVVVSFCGAFPLPRPQLAICAILDEPRKPPVAWASDIAAPVFRAIAQDAINFFDIPVEESPAVAKNNF